MTQLSLTLGHICDHNVIERHKQRTLNLLCQSQYYILYQLVHVGAKASSD